jgi:hypothetical protein
VISIWIVLGGDDDLRAIANDLDRENSRVR